MVCRALFAFGFDEYARKWLRRQKPPSSSSKSDDEQIRLREYVARKKNSKMNFGACWYTLLQLKVLLVASAADLAATPSAV